MSYSSQEVKSGVFISISLALLFALTFVVGNFMGGDKKVWQVKFGYAGGLEENAAVYFAGRAVGKVDKIEVLHGDERPILVTFRIDDEVVLREDSNAFVDSIGLMGEKVVELTPGSNPSAELTAGTVIAGTDPIPMHQLVAKMNLLADRMEDMTSSLNPFIERLDGLTGESEEEIAKMVANLYETSINVRDMTTELKERPWRLLRKG